MHVLIANLRTTILEETVETYILIFTLFCLKFNKKKRKNIIVFITVIIIIIKVCCEFQGELQLIFFNRMVKKNLAKIITM